MPTAQDTTYLIEVMPADATTQDFLSRDVDLLVSQIKENLRLTGLKAKSSVVQGNRSTPYRVPSRSWADPDGCEICSLKNRNEKSNELRLQPDHDQQCHPQFTQIRQHHQHQSYQQRYHRNQYHRHHHHHHLHQHHHHHHHHHLHRCCSSTGREEDDPYELLQELLREGGLIKEAVKRLQANLDELERSEDDDIEEEEEEDEEDEEEDDLEDGMVVNRRSGAKERSKVYRRKPYFYDSEEESLSSVYEPLEL